MCLPGKKWDWLLQILLIALQVGGLAVGLVDGLFDCQTISPKGGAPPLTKKGGKKKKEEKSYVAS